MREFELDRSNSLIFLMSRQLGIFFLIISLFGLVLFLASVQADKMLCSIGLLSAAGILLGIFLITRKGAPPSG